MNRWLAFLNDWGDSTFLGCVEQRMPYFFHYYYLTAIVSVLNLIKSSKKKKKANVCAMGHGGRGNQVTDKSVAGIVTCNLWLLETQNSSLEGMTKAFQWSCAGFPGSCRLESFWKCFLSWCCLGARYSWLGFQTTLSSFVFWRNLRIKTKYLIFCFSLEMFL